MSDQADDKTIRDAEEANRIASEHGVADPGGLPAPETAAADGDGSVDRPGVDAASGGAASLALDEVADDPHEEAGPPQ